MATPQQPNANVGRKRAAVAGIVLAAASLVNYVTKWEGNVLHTYYDIVGVATACSGITDPDIAVPGRKFTEMECRELNTTEIEQYAALTMSCITGRVSQGEFESYASLSYNIGPSAFCSSSAARLVNEGDRIGGCSQILRWNKAGGKVVRGLDHRRKDEFKKCDAARKEDQSQ